MTTTTGLEGTSGSNVTTSTEPDIHNVTIGASSALVYDATHVHSGSTAGKFTGSANFSVLLGAASVRARCYVYFTTATSSIQSQIADFYNASLGTICKIMLQGTGRLRFQDAASTQTDATATFPLNQWVRIEVIVTPGTTTSNGNVQLAYYLGDSTTPVQTWTITTANLGTVNVGQVNFGTTSTSYASDWWMDDVAWDTTGAAFIGPTVANTAPTVTAGSTQSVQAGTEVTVTAAAGDTDGTISTLTGAFVSTPGTAPSLTGTATGTGTASASLSQTFTPTDSGVYTWQATATDDDSATATGTTTINVYPAPGDATILTGFDGADWTNEGGAADETTALSDGDPDTYVQGPDGPAGEIMTVTLGPLGPGDISIGVEGYQDAGSPQLTRTVVVKDASGTTLHTEPDYDLPTTVTTKTITVTNSTAQVGVQVIISDTSA